MPKVFYPDLDNDLIKHSDKLAKQQYLTFLESVTRICAPGLPPDGPRGRDSRGRPPVHLRALCVARRVPARRLVELAFDLRRRLVPHGQRNRRRAHLHLRLPDAGGLQPLLPHGHVLGGRECGAVRDAQVHGRGA